MSAVAVERECVHPITVKIVSMGKGITQYVGDTSLTLGDLLEQLAVPAQMDVRVNGAAAEKAYRLADADEVVIVPKIRGGSA
jgi:molybdopterin converting factor small subunit